MKIIKILVIIYFIFSLPQTSTCQNWQGLGGGINGIRCMFSDTANNMLYIGGSCDWAIPVSGFLGWNGNNWDTTINKNPFGNSLALLSIGRYKDELYVGAGGLKKWNGTNWISITTSTSSIVTSLEVINNEFYVGGGFDSIGDIAANCLAKWDGNIWTSLSLPLSNAHAVYAIASYKGELYAGGNFYNYPPSTDTMRNIIRFDGTNWKSVGGGMHGGMDEVVSMVVYKDELYVAGLFKIADGNVGNYIQKWNGENWSDVGGGVMGMWGSNGQIKQLIVCNDKLFAAGVFEYAGGVPAQYIAVWDGTKWCGLGSTFSNILNSMGVLNDMLYIGGGFGVIDGLAVSHIAKWTGGSYVDTCGNTTSIAETLAENNNLAIYPNPSNGNSITASFPYVEKGDYEALDVLGAVVAKGKITNSDKIEIDISDFARGCYFVRIQWKNKNFVGRFIKY